MEGSIIFISFHIQRHFTSIVFLIAADDTHRHHHLRFLSPSVSFSFLLLASSSSPLSLASLLLFLLSLLVVFLLAAPSLRFSVLLFLFPNVPKIFYADVYFFPLSPSPLLLQLLKNTTAG